MKIIDLLNKIPPDIAVSLFALIYIFAFIKFYNFINSCERRMDDENNNNL